MCSACVDAVSRSHHQSRPSCRRSSVAVAPSTNPAPLAPSTASSPSMPVAALPPTPARDAPTYVPSADIKRPTMTWLLIADDDSAAGIHPPAPPALAGVDRPSTALSALQLKSLAARASCRAAQSLGDRTGCAWLNPWKQMHSRQQQKHAAQSP
jgi:hypothetical protein